MRSKLALLWVSGALLALTGCGKSAAQAAAALTGGDPERGAAALARYGCGSCHTIRGVSGARGRVGPPLSGMAGHSYVAGMLENSPGNLRYWIQHPRAVNPKTAMPELGVTDQDATDISAYIYAIR